MNLFESELNGSTNSMVVISSHKPVIYVSSKLRKTQHFIEFKIIYKLELEKDSGQVP